MEWLPQLQLGWLNGWVLLAVWYSVFGLMLALLPRDVVAKALRPLRLEQAAQHPVCDADGVCSAGFCF